MQGVAGKWVYATSVSGQIIELKMPDTVGLSMSAGTQLILNMHFINPTTGPLSPTLKLNVLYAKNVQYQAGTMVSFNAGIDVPAATAAGPGMQTVSGACSAPVGSKFFAVTSHTHKHATDTKVNFISNGQSQNIVNTTDWESPDVGLFYGPNFLTVNAGDSFTYSCSYTNTTSSGRARRRDRREQRDVHGDRVLLSGRDRELQLSRDRHATAQASCA